MLKTKHFKQTALIILCGLLPTSIFSQQRSRVEAMTIANEFAQANALHYKNLEPKVKTSSEVSDNFILSGKKEAYYVFSYDKKFVIVSGDKRMPDILGYSDSSSFDPNNMPPPVRYWLDCYVECYLRLDNSEPNDIRVTTDVYRVDPLLGDNTWGQGKPYNNHCPLYRNEHCVTGCVATAMAQVMNYHQYPNRGKGRINYTTITNRINVTADFSEKELDWSNMLESYNTYTAEQAEAVSVLMAFCGASVRMDYAVNSQGGSGAYQSDLVKAFVENFGYDKDAAFIYRDKCSTNDWHNIIINELNHGRPVNIGAQSLRDGGHSFVIDGYIITNQYPEYHINWGWDGNCNGFYKIADLAPMTNGQPATHDGFNRNQQIAIRIQPDDGVDDGFVCLGTDRLHISTAAALPSTHLTVYTAELNNFTYKEFAGNLSVLLVNEKNDSVIVGSVQIRPLKYLDVQRNFSVDITLPHNMPEDTYRVSLRAEGKGKYYDVYSKEYPTLEVKSSGDFSDIPQEITSMLGCSEIELITEADGGFSLNVYELQNLEQAPFVGDLRMILSDTSGKQITAIGDSIQPREMAMYDMIPEHQTIKCNHPIDIADGVYRLYLGARNITAKEYEYVSNYDSFLGEAIEQFYQIRINKGQVVSYEYYIGGHSGMSVVVMKPAHIVLTMQGIPVTLDHTRPHLQRGVYVINGKKVVVK